MDGAHTGFMSNQDRTSRYVIVNEGSNRIVATTPGTHSILKRLCERLEGRKGGSYFYDDATNSGAYLPQVGENVGLSVGRSTTPSRVRMDMW